MVLMVLLFYKLYIIKYYKSYKLMWTIIKLYLYQCFIYVLWASRVKIFHGKSNMLPMLLIDPHIWWLSPNCPQVSLLKISRNSVK